MSLVDFEETFTFVLFPPLLLWNTKFKTGSRTALIFIAAAETTPTVATAITAIFFRTAHSHVLLLVCKRL